MTIPASVSGSAGMWTGTNGFRLMPSDPLHEASSSAEVSVRAGGHLVAVAYTWSHPEDGAQDGLLVLGAADAGGIVAFWGDSWHQHPEPKVFSGTAEGGVVTVSYEYAPGWWWVIVVDSTSEALRIRMDNVVPAEAADSGSGGAYPAMVMDLRRVTP